MCLSVCTRCLASQCCTCGDKAIKLGTSSHVYGGWKPNPRVKVKPPRPQNPRKFVVEKKKKRRKKKIKNNKVGVMPNDAPEFVAVDMPKEAVKVDMPKAAVAVAKPSDAAVVDMPPESVAVEMPIEEVIPVEIPTEMLQLERKGNWKVSFARFFAWPYNVIKKARGRRQQTGNPFYNGASPV